MDIFANPSLMTASEGEPRIIDTIFNVTGLVSNLFNTSNNALFTYVGGLVLFIVLVGEEFETIQSFNLVLILVLFQNLLYML